MNLLNRSSLSLMNKIIMTFVAYITLMLIAFSVIVIVIDRGHIREISVEYSEAVLDSRIGVTSEWLDERINDVQILAMTSQVRSMDPNTAMVLLREAITNHDDVYIRYYLINKDGSMTDTLGIESQTTESYDFTNSDAGSHGAIVTEPKNDTTFKQATIEVLVPVVVDGSAEGVLGATVLLKDLRQLTSEKALQKQGYAWIVNKDGQVVSHRDLDLIGTTITERNESLSSILERAVEDGKGTANYVNANGDREYVSFEKLTQNGNDWYVMVSLMTADIYSVVGRLMVNMSVLVVVLAVASYGFAWYIAREVTSPIQSLIEVTGKFTAGVKGIRANIESNDEIGTLATSFNNMADTIVAHTDNLEEMIKERTQILADLNYQIVSRNKELGTMNEELEKTNNKLHELASTDMLTGLYNRHEFQRELQKAVDLVNADREDSFAVLFVDLDNFKYYNDTFSHEIGDFLLQEVSDILSNNVRGNDVVGRYGGDEFVILLREGNYDVAKTIAQRIHSAILEKDGFKNELRKKLNADVKIMGKNKLSSSIGIVRHMKSMNITDADDLLAKADETMYKAKKAGKSRIVVG